MQPVRIPNLAPPPMILPVASMDDTMMVGTQNHDIIEIIVHRHRKRHNMVSVYYMRLPILARHRLPAHLAPILIEAFQIVANLPVEHPEIDLLLSSHHPRRLIALQQGLKVILPEIAVSQRIAELSIIARGKRLHNPYIRHLGGEERYLTLHLWRKHHMALYPGRGIQTPLIRYCFFECV